MEEKTVFVWGELGLLVDVVVVVKWVVNWWLLNGW